MFVALGKYTYSYRKWIVAASVLVFLVAVVFGSGAIDRLKPGGFEDKNSESFVAKELLEEKLGQGQSNLFVVFSSGHLAVDDPRFQSAVEEALATTMSTAGKAVAFSGIAVAISMLGLLFFPMNFLQSMGLGGAGAYPPPSTMRTASAPTIT